MISPGTYQGLVGNDKRTLHLNSGVFSIPSLRYCKEVEDTIRTAKFLNYMQPTEYQLRVLSDTISELKTNRIWSEYDVCWAFGYNSQLAYEKSFRYADVGSGNLIFPTTVVFQERPRSPLENFTFLNLKNPLAFQCSLVKGTIRPNYPFYSEKGWCSGNPGGGTDFGALSTNWVAKDNGVKWTQNNAGGMIYLNKENDTAVNAYCIGDLDSVNTRTTFRLMPYGASGQIIGLINTNNTTRTYVASGITTAGGVNRLERTSSTLATFYRDGVSLGTNTNTGSTILSTLPLYICAFNQDGSRIAGIRNAVMSVALGAALGATLTKVEADIWTNYAAKMGCL